MTLNARGERTHQGHITLSTATQSCTRGGDYTEMMRGCALRPNVGELVTVLCTTNFAENRRVYDISSNLLFLRYTYWNQYTVAATFTYMGDGVQLTCNYRI